MYTTFYELNEKPFQISSDPDFMWFGEKHQEALATLKYGVLDNKGFLLLTGDVGTGKTTLINALIQSLSDDVVCTTVPDPNLSKIDFFNYVASSFGINREFTSKGSFLVEFRKFLIKTYEANKKVLLIIDEAQLLTQELLEEIRLLSNIEKANSKLINIFFVGQNEFNEILNQNQNRAVRQRLTLNYNIDPLTPDETEKYIKYRLKVAGAVKPIFEPSAVQEVFMYSGGFPRRINVICDHALLSGYVNDSDTITEQIVQECAKELKIPAYVQNRDINGFGSYHSKPAPTVQSRPVVLKPRTIEKKKRDTGNIIMLIIAVALFSSIGWWLLFPASFQQFISKANKQVEILKNNTSKMVPESSKPGLVSEKIEYDQNTLNSQQEKQNIQNPEPIVQNILIEEQDSRTLSDNILKQSSSTLIKSAGSIKEEQDNLTEQNSKIKKTVLPLPQETIIIRFKYDTNDFTEEGFNRLKKFGDILAMYPGTQILVKGYTDSVGSQIYNVKLSEFRANIIRSFLLGRGVMVKQIKVKGLGSINPIEDNNTSWGRTMNRRVEIEIVKE
ncbi:MAG: AAA family ATPase [Deltaproteobacteria bacterium]|jgi:general secretion pathway protein A|nr:AAA family ATPase [Deltaproteobacteria bacterium]